MLLISSYSLEKADVNYRAGVLCALELNCCAVALCALELNCCAGSKLPGGSPRRCLISALLNLDDAHSSDAPSQTLRV